MQHHLVKKSYHLGMLAFSMLFADAVHANQTLQAKVILAKESKEECSKNNYRKEYVLKSVVFQDPRDVTRQQSEFRRELRGDAKPAPHVYTDRVMPGQCYAISLVQMQIGKCKWETYTWRIGATEKAVEDALEKHVDTEPGARSHRIQQKGCLGKGTDTSIGVRG